MSYILNYSSVFQINTQPKSRFLGSSKYRVVNDELIEIQKNTRKLNDNKKQSVMKAKETVRIHVPDSEVKEIDMPVVEEKQLYHLNKSKIKRKCYALSRLEKSKKFLAFYSISFPQGLSDNTAYKVFNTWLTRCRKNSNMNTYLWVAERQKNGTIHFHLLTNDRMEIRQVNGFMATALTTEKNKGNEALYEVDTSIYNGVDVRQVKKNKKGLINYIAKYVSKNEIEFYRLPWHCSRYVSRLFTATTFEDNEADFYLDQLPNDLIENYTRQITDYNFYNGYGFKFTAPDSIFENIDSVNEIIYRAKNDE